MPVCLGGKKKFGPLFNNLDVFAHHGMRGHGEAFSEGPVTGRSQRHTLGGLRAHNQLHQGPHATEALHID